MALETTLESTRRPLNPESTESTELSYQGPAWNTTSEYPSLDCNEFVYDRSIVEGLIKRIEESVSAVRPLMNRVLSSGSNAQNSQSLSDEELRKLISHLQEISKLSEQSWTILKNMQTYVHCEMSIDSRNESAARANSVLSQLSSLFENAQKPFTLFLEQAPDSIISAYLNHPHTEPEAFAIRQARLDADTLLSEAEETLIARLKLNGPDAWGDLYEKLAGTMVCRVNSPSGQVQEMGLAKAAGLLRDASEPVRKSAWLAIQDGWKSNESSVASILNGLAGWRLDLCERRSHTRKIDFLHTPLHWSRIQRETLQAMMKAVESRVEVARRAMRAMAQAMGKTQHDPWDLLAAPPSSGKESRRPYREGLSLIRNAFRSVDPEMGEFISMMEKNRWIEGRVLPNKQQGAYCTGFSKSRTPRVFQTYMGSVSDIRTLAHELGHAYHSYIMRDLPAVLHRYPMTLAETASIFAETLFADQLSQSGDESTRFEIAWQDAEAAAAMLLNIPARFDFERSFYEQRKSGFVSARELCDLTESAWRKWYGDTLSQMDRQFWMSKLHFSISGISFYNFPYTFGYLFSLSLYARRESLGANFVASYNNLLRDTGRMTAEELVQKHIGEDITKPEFWLTSLDIVEGQVANFEGLVRNRMDVRLRQ